MPNTPTMRADYNWSIVLLDLVKFNHDPSVSISVTLAIATKSPTAA